MKPSINNHRQIGRPGSVSSFALAGSRPAPCAIGSFQAASMAKFGLLGSALLAGVLPGCSGSDVTQVQQQQQQQLRTGSVSMAVTLVNARRDVVGFDFTIHPAGAGCGSDPVQTIRRQPLEAEGLPERFHDNAADSVGDNHPFADAFFVLDAGRYDVCARPVDEDGAPSEVCEVALRESVRVREGETNEIRPALVSQCEVAGAGALDVIATLNSPPQLVDLDYDPGKFINTCQTLTLTPEAFDADGDEVTFSWEIVSQPGNANVSLPPEGAPIEFSTEAEGDYELRLTVSDSYDGVNGIESSTELVFPIHVESGGNCDSVGADLVPVGTAGFPGFFAFCERRDSELLVTVANEGVASSSASTTVVEFAIPGGDAVEVLLPTPEIEAGESVQVQAPIPAACGDTCSFRIEVDSANSVPELNETNNNTAGSCFG